jgi:hypothetical protein
VSKDGQITAQKIVWWALVTLAGVLISIAGGWVGSVNASIPALSERVAKQESFNHTISAQYATIIKELQRRSE